MTLKVTEDLTAVRERAALSQSALVKYHEYNIICSIIKTHNIMITQSMFKERIFIVSIVSQFVLIQSIR